MLSADPFENCGANSHFFSRHSNWKVERSGDNFNRCLALFNYLQGRQLSALQHLKIANYGLRLSAPQTSFSSEVELSTPKLFVLCTERHFGTTSHTSARLGDLRGKHSKAVLLQAEAMS